MTLDIRANVFCDKGPVISGGFSDDHVQGTGLIRTRGEVVLQGLVTLNPGDLLQLGYEKAGFVILIPRALRVLSSFADPFRRQTTVSVGCKLTMMETLRENKETNPAEDEANSGIPCEEFGKVPINITFDHIATTCLTELGITAATPLGLEGSVSIDSYSFSSGYVSILSDILFSQSKVGFLNAEEQLQVVDLSVLEETGPVYEESDVIDVSPVRSGDIPADVVIVEYSYNRLKEPDEDEVNDEDERKKRDWELDITQGEPEFHYIWYNNGDSLYLATHYPLSTSVTEYDALDRVTRREQRTSTLGAKLNSAYLTELLEETGELRDNTGSAEEVVEEEFLYAYDADELIVPPTDLAPCSYWYTVGSSATFDEERDSQPIEQIVTTYQPEIGVAGSLNLPTYFYDDGDLHPGTVLSPVEVTRISFETHAESGITKSITYRQSAYCMTTHGQQGLAKMAEEIDSVDQAYGMLLAGLSLVNTGVNVETHYDRYYGLQKRPSLQERLEEQFYKDPRESVSEMEFIQGEEGVGVTTTYSVPWSPDDEIAFSTNSSNPYVVVASNAEELARRFGRVQQQLTYGHRMGFGVQMSPDKLPPYAASTATLHLGGIMAQYMVNGQSWTFDSNGIVANVDMVYIGGVGATSEEYRTPSPWSPVQDGITQLPLAPAITTNIDAAPANSIPTPFGFDPNAAASIFTTLPTDSPPVYEKEVTVTAVVPAYREVQIYNFTTHIRADATRTLIFLPLDDRDATPRVRLSATAEQFTYPSRDVAPRVVTRAAAESFAYAARDSAPTVRTGASPSVEVLFMYVEEDAVPVAGSDVTTSTPVGWTQIYSGNVDDTPLEVTGLQFPFRLNGVSYTSFWLSPNGYITFGAGSSQYTGLTATNPALPKIFINATDDSMQKVFVRSTANTFRVRVEGNTSATGSGTTYRVWEVAFFNPDAYYGINAFEVRMGVSPDNSGLFNVYSASALLGEGTAPVPAPNKSWLFENYEDAAGYENKWFNYPSHHITPVE
jgi:hypothetical protein